MMRPARGAVDAMTLRESPHKDESVTDLGRHGDVDRPQIEALLRLTPTERLRKHEGWRLFVKEALASAELRRSAGHAPR